MSYSIRFNIRIYFLIMLKVIFLCYCLFLNSILAVVHVNSLKNQSLLGLNQQLSIQLDVLNGNNHYVSFIPDYRLNYGFSYDQYTQFFLIASMHYAKKKDITIKDKSFYHFRFIRYFSDTFRYDLFFQEQSNIFKLLKHRLLMGGSLGKNVLESSLFSYDINLGLMHEYESLSTDIVTRLIRLTHFQQLYMSITESLQLYTIFYYQPDILSFDDYRLLLENKCVLTLTEYLNYSLTLHFDYDSVVEDSLSSYDIAIKQFISFKF